MPDAGEDMDAAARSSHEALVAARRDAWEAMSPAERRRLVRGTVKDFSSWAAGRRQPKQRRKVCKQTKQQ